MMTLQKCILPTDVEFYVSGIHECLQIVIICPLDVYVNSINLSDHKSPKSGCTLYSVLQVKTVPLSNDGESEVEKMERKAHLGPGEEAIVGVHVPPDGVKAKAAVTESVP